MITPVLLAGGQGAQLWPLSRELSPKQFHVHRDGRSVFQESALRFSGAADFAATVVVCPEAHRFTVGEQLQTAGVNAQAVLLEPELRGSAAAAFAAAAWVASRGDGLLLISSTDVVIEDAEALLAAVRSAADFAHQGHVVCFGVEPRHSDPSFGFVQRGDSVSGQPEAGKPAFVRAFVRFPEASRVEALREGGWLWNSGMFLVRAARLLELLEAPDAASAGSVRAAVAAARCDVDFVRLDGTPWSAVQMGLLDETLLQHMEPAIIVPVDVGWSELGTWRALHDLGARDAAGNVCEGDVVCEESSNCYLRSESRLLAAVGLSEHVVVETRDAVLVAHRDRLHELRNLTQRLKTHKRPEWENHRRVARPWGSYEGIDQADGYQVKRISVKPGASLSLQLHHRRSEHWVVVRGRAVVTRGDEVLHLAPNQSTYIPIGMAHRLENPGPDLLELIEVQCGSYLGEDDIVRLEDRYGRASP